MSGSLSTTRQKTMPLVTVTLAKTAQLAERALEERRSAFWSPSVRSIYNEVTIAQKLIIPPDTETSQKGLQALYDKGVRALAIVLLHSYSFPDHEIRLREIAREIGFTQSSISSDVSPMIRVISRGYSASADAYLSPLTRAYLDGFRAGFVGELEDKDGARCEFMQSDGGLVGWQSFNGLKAILSGPAGGVVGMSRTCFDEKRRKPVIGFDMGGTSTDVSRYAGRLEHTFESITAGITIQSPQLEVDTVAAGKHWFAGPYIWVASL